MRRIAFVVAAVVAVASPVFAQDTKDEKKDDKKNEKEKPSAADLALAKKLERQKVTFKLDGTPFAEVVDMMRDLCSVDFVIDGPAQDVVDAESVTVTYNANDATAKDCIASFVRKANDNLAHEIWKGVVWIGTKASLEQKPEKPKVDDETRKKLDVNVKVSDTDETLADVLKSLKTQSKVTFSVAKEIDASAIRVGLRLHDMKAADAVEVLCRLFHYSAEGKDGEVVFSPAKSK
ncbi:MAG TPA: hypothetical protein VFF73_28535 [Planctomycetota bacterium]|nr:hypothetical protein [Planctomycetota bacterium]